jgi:methylisocitrate lyase
MFIEDQVFPKRCGHMAGKNVTSTEEMLAKLKAALDARVDADFTIMARTDAIAVHGIDEAVARLAAYREVGADLLFADGAQSVAQMRQLCEQLDGPMMANMIDGGVTPVLPLSELAEIGFAVATYPLGATYVVAKAMRNYMMHLAEHQTTAGYVENMIPFEAFNDMVGLSELRRREALYLDVAANNVKK